MTRWGHVADTSGRERTPRARAGDAWRGAIGGSARTRGTTQPPAGASGNIAAREGAW